MSATIHYRITSKEDPYLKKVGYPSSFIEAMGKAFGCFPVELDESSIPTLRGMAAASNDGAAFEEVIAKIEQHGSIELYASY